MKKKKERYVSMFVKSVMAFAIIGIIPMLVMGFSIYREYSGKVTESLLVNASQISDYTQKNISDLLTETDEYTRYLYQYGISEFDYFYQVFLNEEITDAKREMLVNDILRNLLYRNDYIRHVFFIDYKDRVYTEKRVSEKKPDLTEMVEFHKQSFRKEPKNAYYLAPHPMKYYENSNDFAITAVRNIYNTKSVEKASEEIVGTVYLDLDIRFLDELIESIKGNFEQDIYLISKTDGRILYHKDRSNIGVEYKDYSRRKEKFQTLSGIAETTEKYMIYSEIEGTDWMLVNDLLKEIVRRPYEDIEKNTVFLIFLAGLLIGIIYLFYATRTNRPMKELMNTMSLIQHGDLSAKARVKTHDEIAVIAEGLNEMTEKLESHINQVYVAQIKQRDAQMDALRMQIQPHYLYNTLDVIRMSALTSQDFETAEMLDSLSSQLKYAISTTKDMVSLRVEAESIINYFKLVKIRFENRYELEMQIPEELMDYVVPKIILQPSVENAIKHGFRLREGNGRIQISAENEDDMLVVTIMDNGVGIGEQQLEEIQTLLEGIEPGKKEGNNWESVGIKNVHDRIRLMFGDRYGVVIDSVEGIGTIVKYKLPFIDPTKEGNIADV